MSAEGDLITISVLLFVCAAVCGALPLACKLKESTLQIVGYEII